MPEEVVTLLRQPWLFIFVFVAILISRASQEGSRPESPEQLTKPSRGIWCYSCDSADEGVQACAQFYEPLLPGFSGSPDLPFLDQPSKKLLYESMPQFQYSETGWCKKTYIKYHPYQAEDEEEVKVKVKEVPNQQNGSSSLSDDEPPAERQFEKMPCENRGAWYSLFDWSCPEIRGEAPLLLPGEDLFRRSIAKAREVPDNGEQSCYTMRDAEGIICFCQTELCNGAPQVGLVVPCKAMIALLLMVTLFWNLM